MSSITMTERMIGKARLMIHINTLTMWIDEMCPSEAWS